MVPDLQPIVRAREIKAFTVITLISDGLVFEEFAKHKIGNDRRAWKYGREIIEKTDGEMLNEHLRGKGRASSWCSNHKNERECWWASALITPLFSKVEEQIHRGKEEAENGSDYGKPGCGVPCAEEP
jgi:hypothetical protein